MPQPPEIIELRKILAERFPQQRGTHLLTPTGWPPLDSLLGGGLPKGSITQLIVPPISAGGAIVLHEIIEAMHEHSQCVALIDGQNSFEPSTDYPLLLWIRCQNAVQALKATDLVLRDSNLPFSILDFKQNSDTELKKIPGTVWYRFQRIIEENKSTLLAITRSPVVSSAQISIMLTHHLIIDDMTSLRSEIVKLLSLEIVRHRPQLEYRYA
jgi:hypothetical protein